MRLIAFVFAAVGATSALAADLSGSYNIDGSNPGGAGYKGKLTIAKAGEAYALTWDSGGISSGIGVSIGDRLAVAVGPQCAVATYRAAAEGGLDGLWVGPKGGKLASERAVPGVGTTQGLTGDYVVNGVNPDGKPYKGGLIIGADADGIRRYSWRTGSNFEGYGIEQDGYSAAVWGAPDCGVVLYQVGADGSLSGIWRYPGTGAGTEKATR